MTQGTAQRHRGDRDDDAQGQEAPCRWTSWDRKEVVERMAAGRRRPWRSIVGRPFGQDEDDAALAAVVIVVVGAAVVGWGRRRLRLVYIFVLPTVGLILSRSNAPWPPRLVSSSSVVLVSWWSNDAVFTAAFRFGGGDALVTTEKVPAMPCHPSTRFQRTKMTCSINSVLE
jgi:hypothetical protein